jgi:hypothetical protein|tara:strand:+ start:525 stop:641 length:117 start_codon:yes stop_codon:yes gene_type:complete
MKNKLILVLVFLVILSACGKKGDPEYQSNNFGMITKKL